MYAAKAWVSFVGTILAALTAAFADNVLSVDETGQVVSVVVVALATLYSTYRVPNDYSKGR